jgi:hypothetical protein
LFYNHIYTVDEAVSGYMSSVLSREANGCRFRGFDVGDHLDGSPTGLAPVHDSSWTLGAAAVGALDLPSEIAVCNSFHDATNLGEGGHTGPRPASRHRGRNYIGPLNDLAVDNDGVPHVLEAFRLAITGAASSDDINTGNVTWSVWSRKNAAMYAVTAGFVDDAFDVQRRRGEKASTRTVWPD